MASTSLIFAAVMPIFLIITAGFYVRKFQWLDERADRSLMRLVVNLLYPCLIFSFILGNDALRQSSNIILPPLIGFTSVLAGFGLCMLIARKFNIGSPRECRTFAFCTGLNNYGYFPIPIIALLFDRETTGVLLVHNVGVEIAMWSLGVGFILSARAGKSVWRRIFSPPVISILIAVPMNLLRVEQYLPQALLQSLNLLGQCAIPLGLLLIGATFSDLAKGVRAFEKMRVPLLATLLRMGIFPIAYLVFIFLFPLSLELQQVLIIQAAMPCAVFPIVLTRHFDGSSEIALKVVLSTTLVGLLTIPLWVRLGISVIDR
jgi:malate permease and related proteins